MTALGFLYPGHSAEDDYPRIEQLLGSDIRVDVVHTDIGEDAHRVDALREMGAAERLAMRLQALRLSGAEAVVWACTSGSFVYGYEGAHDQIRTLARTAGCPPPPPPSPSPTRPGRWAPPGWPWRRPTRTTSPRCSSTSWRRPGSRSSPCGAAGIITAAEVGTWGLDETLALARAADHPEAEALLLPDTALHTASHIPTLEKELGKPVLTANQVTVWEALRLADRRVNAPELGALFTREPIVQVR